MLIRGIRTLYSSIYRMITIGWQRNSIYGKIPSQANSFGYGKPDWWRILTHISAVPNTCKKLFNKRLEPCLMSITLHSFAFLAMIQPVARRRQQLMITPLSLPRILIIKRRMTSKSLQIRPYWQILFKFLTASLLLIMRIPLMTRYLWIWQDIMTLISWICLDIRYHRHCFLVQMF